MNLCNFPFTSLLEEDMQALDYSTLSDTSTGIFPLSCCFYDDDKLLQSLFYKTALTGQAD